MVDNKAVISQLEIQCLGYRYSVSMITPSVVTLIPPPLLLQLILMSLLARIVLKLGREALESGTCSCSHVSVKHTIKH